jgi:hypothetical protein
VSQGVLIVHGRPVDDAVQQHLQRHQAPGGHKNKVRKVNDSKPNHRSETDASAGTCSQGQPQSPLNALMPLKWAIVISAIGRG